MLIQPKCNCDSLPGARSEQGWEHCLSYVGHYILGPRLPKDIFGFNLASYQIVTICPRPRNKTVVSCQILSICLLEKSLLVVVRPGLGRSFLQEWVDSYAEPTVKIINNDIKSLINFEIGHLKCEGKSPFVPFPDEVKKTDYYFKMGLEFQQEQWVRLSP